MSEELRKIVFEAITEGIRLGTTLGWEGWPYNKKADMIEKCQPYYVHEIQSLFTQELNKFAGEVKRDVIGEDEDVEPARREYGEGSKSYANLAEKNRLRATQRTALTAKLKEWATPESEG